MRHCVFVLLAAVLSWPGQAIAHSKAPALLELRSSEDGQIIAGLKQNLSLALADPQFPSQCRIARSYSPQREGDAIWKRWKLDCGGAVWPEGLIGWPELSETNVVLQLFPDTGQSHSVLLHRNRPSYRISEQPAASEQFSQAVGLGLSHLFAGLDHLLFIIGLVLYLGCSRSLVVAASLFTLGHSLTLALATLNWLHVPVVLSELAIAGSILFMATMLLRNLHRPANPGWLNVVLMPLGFGLLHGMGFASVLESSGLRSGDLLVNLFGFNLGIELGQLACILIILLLQRVPAWLHFAPRWHAPIAPTLIWMMGTMAAYWCWERTGALIA